MDKNAKICVIGHKGMLGHAIWRQLTEQGFTRLIGCDLPEVDLCSQRQTDGFFAREKPEYVFFLAAVAAGIQYKKTHPVEMLQKNLQIVTNVFSSAYAHGCRRMINVCSALLYPSEAQIPLREEDAVHANLHQVDTPYALAKAAGMQLARYYNQEYHTQYITVVPCNFFGEYAPFEGDRAGVVPSLIRRIHEAKIQNAPQVEVWGTGNACRELLNSKDVARACIFIMNHDQPTEDLINIGRGFEYSIREVAQMIQKLVGYEGELFFDASKPEGRQHMQLDTGRLKALGWKPEMDLEESIRDAYAWFLNSGKGE